MHSRHDDTSDTVTRFHKYSAEEDEMSETSSELKEILLDQEYLTRLIKKACTNDDVEAIEQYVGRKYVNHPLNTGWTPLLYAASCVQPKIIKYLLSHGADPNQHIDGITPLMVLCNSTKGTLASFLCCLKLLIEAKADVNVTNKHKETALMLACKSRESCAVEELLKYVRNINACDGIKRTALFYAVSANKPETVTVLLAKGADTIHTDENDITALEIAVIKGYTKIQSLLECKLIPTTDPIRKVIGWEDMFPFSNKVDDDTISREIAGILDGMGLSYYRKNFRGVDLRTFFRLTEHDLKHLGIDISIHRQQFMENVFKLHSKKWSIQSVGTISSSNTIHDWITSLGNLSRQIIVIGGSFDYIAKGLADCTDRGIHPTDVEQTNYEKQLEKASKTVQCLKKELLLVKAFAQKIDKEQRPAVPGEYIEPVARKSKCILNFISTVTLLIGSAYLCTTLSKYF